MLPDRGRMSAIFWAWDRLARKWLYWSQLEQFAHYGRDVELAESMGRKGARSDFVRINDQGFQTPSFLICDQFAINTTAQALLLTSVDKWVVRGRGSPFDADYLSRLCQCHDSAVLSYSDNGQAEGITRASH